MVKLTVPTRVEIARLAGNDQRLIIALTAVFQAALDAETVAAQVDQNTLDIGANETGISTNAANISTNTINIAANAGDISANTSAIATNAANIATNTADIAALPSFVYSMLKANGDTASSSIANTEVAIGWATAEITSADATVSGSEITIGSTGTYRLTVALRVSGNNRVELFVRTYVDTGGGKVENTAEQASNYALRDADQNTGTTVLNTALALSSGDVLEFRGFADADGTAIMVDDGTRVMIERAL